MQAHIFDITKVLASDYTQMHQAIKTTFSLKDEICQRLESASSSVAILNCAQSAQHPSSSPGASDSREQLQQKIRVVNGARRRTREQLFSLLLELWRVYWRTHSDVQNKLAETIEDSTDILAIQEIRELQDFVISMMKQHGDIDSTCEIGVYMSDVASLSLSLDDLIIAEGYLVEGEQLLKNEKRLQCAKARIERTAKHADLLASQLDIDVSAAESRYQGAIHIAKRYGFQREMAHFQGKYALFLTDQGRDEEAVQVTNQALRTDSTEPVARLAKVKAQQQAGELDSSTKIMAAKDTLDSLKDGLAPAAVEENLRLELFSSFDSWGKVAEVQGQKWSAGGIIALGRQCMQYSDVAELLICFICGGTFPH